MDLDISFALGIVKHSLLWSNLVVFVKLLSYDFIEITVLEYSRVSVF